MYARWQSSCLYRSNEIVSNVEFPNWNFEQGLSGWAKEGTAFNNQPTRDDNISTQRIMYNMEYNNGGVGGDYWKDQGFNQGYKDRHWIGTYENNPNGSNFLKTQGDGVTGTLTSDEFVITTSFCYFLIGGGADAQHLYVELEIKQPDGTWKREAIKSCFRNSEQMYREKFSLQGLQNKMARIRIVDNSTGGWGHINVDHFRFTNHVLPGIILTDLATRTSYEVDEDVPVWGFADTHAHPANNLGFGKRLIVGKANAPLSETYSNTLCHNHHTTGGNGVLNTPFIGGADVHKYMDGWPNFIDFPKFDSKTHNQQNVEFLKRAWQGGLRLFSALAVNNMFLPSIALGPGNDGSPYDDESTILQQIQEIKNIAISQSSWMEIAYTAKDARRIIMQGKLAVVLGVEMDNFGNFKTSTFNWDDNVNPANAKLVTLNESNADQLLENKLNQYYNLGIRQVTPMHYISGVFGGAAIFRAEIAMIQFAFNNNVSVVSGISKKIPYSLQDDYSLKMILAGESPASFLTKINGLGALGNINALGMTNIGTKLMNKFMDKGFIMDSEHMGYEMKETLFSMAALRNYPIMSSHTDPAGLNFNWINQPVSFGGTREFRMQNFGTTNIRNIATEFNLADEHYQKIKNSTQLAGQSTVESIPNQKLINGSYVSNPDKILDEGTVAQIDTLLKSLEKRTTVQVAVVAIESIGDDDVFEFAQKLFNTRGIGNKSNDNGLLLLLVKDKHTIRFHAGYGVEGVLPDVVCKRIQRDYMVPEFKNGNYDAGMLAGLKQVEKFLTDSKYAEELRKPEADEVSDWVGFVIFLLIFFVPILLVIFIIKATNGRFADSKKLEYTPYPEMRSKRWPWLLEFVGIPFLIIVLFGFSPVENPAGLCFLTLYLYGMLTLFHRLWRMKKVINRFLESQEYYEIVQFIRKEQLYWFFMAVLFPLPFVFYFFYHLARKRLYRNHPRKCTRCQGAMHTLNEKTEDQYLSKAQQMEETLRAVDYDVWKCEACQATEAWNYPNRHSKYETCPKCKTMAYYFISRRSVVDATYSSSGSGEEVHACKFCGYTNKSSYTIAQLTHSSSSSSSSSSFVSSSSSSGGSWGGGRSGGGGASSSW